MCTHFIRTICLILAVNSLQQCASVRSALAQGVLTCDTGSVVLQVDASPNGRWIATINSAGTMRIYDAKHGKFSSSQVDALHFWSGFSQDSRLLGVVAGDRSRRVWKLGRDDKWHKCPDFDIYRKKEYTPSNTEILDWVFAVFLPESEVLLTAISRDDETVPDLEYRIARCDTTSGACEILHMELKTDLFADMAISNDCRRLYTSGGEEVCIFDLASGRLLQSHRGTALAKLLVSPNGRWVAAITSMRAINEDRVFNYLHILDQLNDNRWIELDVTTLGAHKVKSSAFNSNSSALLLTTGTKQVFVRPLDKDARITVIPQPKPVAKIVRLQDGRIRFLSVNKSHLFWWDSTIVPCKNSTAR